MVFFYIFEEILQDFYKFLRFWYKDSVKFIFDEYVKSFSIIEKNFSIRLNLKNFFKPLYGLRSIETYFYAIPFRIILIFISLILHILNTLIFLTILIFWCLLPFLSISLFKKT